MISIDGVIIWAPQKGYTWPIPGLADAEAEATLRNIAGEMKHAADERDSIQSRLDTARWRFVRAADLNSGRRAVDALNQHLERLSDDYWAALDCGDF